MNLTCYCDHCPDSTCTTKENGLCFAQMRLNDQDEIVETYNCFHHDFTLLQNIICDPESNIKKSSSIVKCCNNADHCNRQNNFLPSVAEAKLILLKNKFIRQYSLSSKRIDLLHNSSSPLQLGLNSAFQQYSNFSPEFKLGMILFSGLLLIVSLAFGQGCFQRKHQRRQYSRAPIPPRTNNPNELEVPADEENDIGRRKTDSEAGDSISMASREPLITTDMALLQHPRPSTQGPYDSKIPRDPREKSTFQMTVGVAMERKKNENSSGSGIGKPYLTQRRLVDDIALCEVVGRGYFGVVWRAEYKGEPIAVKIFSAMAETSWRREAEIYQTSMLRHKNILGFIATDQNTDGLQLGYWLVTDFCPMGSLYDFISRNTLCMKDAIRMAFSIANGLAHLHSEICGTHGKPAMAHRDIKSRNILVKNDGTCCIADMGMAVRHNSRSGIVDVPTNTRVGTRRYLAPELLDNRLNLMDFEAVKAADIYAFGLVLWEILRRTSYLLPPPRAIVRGFPFDGDDFTGVKKEDVPEDLRPRPADQPIPPRKNPVSTGEEPKPSSSRQTIDTGDKERVPQEEKKPSDMQMNLPNIGVEQKVEEEKQVGQENKNLGEDSNAPPLPQQNPIGNDFLNYQSASPEISHLMDANLHDPSVRSIDDPRDVLCYYCDHYAPPYFEFVPDDPTWNDMRKVVCEERLRPSISYRWTRFTSMRDFAMLMYECWYENPMARLTALRIRKTLADMGLHYYNINMIYE